MGASTQIDVGVDPQTKNRLRDLQKDVVTAKKTLDTIKPTLDSITQKLKSGVKLTPDQVKYAQQLIELNKKLSAEINDKMITVTELQNKLSEAHKAEVVVMDNAYPGTTVSIGELSMVIKKPVKYSRFVAKDGDVKLAPI
jgi:uncharacterized protein (DUF342 family)